MIDLSIIIVSYNVKFFVAQCIASIDESEDNLVKEIIVIDNSSEDGSAPFIETHFPHVKVIKNETNTGFSKANNQGFYIAQGEYILILNPDTLLTKNTLQICYDFLRRHSDYGAVGVKMIDGRGNYLPESKRSLPTIISSLWKFTQIHTLFPQNAYFNKYYLGQLSENEDHDIQVLTGAFIFSKKTLLDDLKGFDESFFMYGEDIDLCKRILDSGKKIKYLASTEIVHFKGESTKKNSLRYLKSFYGAMKIYTLKHTQGNEKLLTNAALHISIGILALVNGLKIIFTNYSHIIIDFFVAFICYASCKWLWAYYYFDNPNYFDNQIYVNLTGYSFITILGIWFTGWHEKNSKSKYLFLGATLALIIMLLIYAVLPEFMRYSRAIIFLGLMMTIIFVYLLRYYQRLFKDKTKTIVIVSKKENIQFIQSILDQKLKKYFIIGYIHPSLHNEQTDYLANIDQFYRVIEEYKPDFILFNSQMISMSQLSQYMTIPSSRVKYLLTSIDQKSVIEAENKNNKSSIWEVEPIYNLAKPIYRRTKRFIDLVIGFGSILIIPVFLWKGHNAWSMIQSLLLGTKTLIGYSQSNSALPVLKSGILNTSLLIGEVINGEIVEDANKSDICYAKYYHPVMDINLIIKFITS